MPKKAGPSLLCEWMVGTSIQSALGSLPKAPKTKPRPKKRDLIKLHVTTDEESGEDTLTITYPRFERLDRSKETPVTAPEPVAPEPESESEPEAVEVVKKVRFQKEPASAVPAMPKKSAMKKKTLVTFCEEEETTSDSSGDVASTSASSGEATPEASSSNESSAADTSSAGDTSSDESSKAAKASRTRKFPKSRNTEKSAQSSDSEGGSDPHPTCKCKDCTTERKKRKQEPVCEKRKCKKNERIVSTKKAEPETESESEASASEAESSTDEKPLPSKKAKDKKVKKKAEVSDTEGETSESTKEASESEEVPKNSQEKKKNKIEKGGKKAEDSSKNEGETKTEESKKVAEKEKESEAKSDAGKGKAKEIDDSKKLTAEATSLPYESKYANGHPYAHSRPPNLISPIRAEVMHTERVVETQDDPLPNAYYDALHNVVRVYHGSVYGQNGRHMFANREGTSGHPHHTGTSHPMQNLYNSSYNNVMPFGPPPPPQQQLPIHGYEHVPITQGMPMPGWNAMVPPPGYPPYNYYGGPILPPWYDQQLNKQARGALDINDTPGSKRGKSKSQEPDNNVMPEATKPNPYYTKRVSPFSNMGSNRPASNGKPPSNSGNSKNGGKDDGPNWDNSSRRSVGAWANSSNHGGATWGDAAPAETKNNTGDGDQWGTGGGDAWNTTSNSDQWNNTGGNQWGAGSNNGAWTASGNDQNTQSVWNTGDSANTGGAIWGDGTANDQQQTTNDGGNNGNQNQGQSSPPTGEKEPTPAMIDNNVAPIAVTTAPSEEQSKMPGSWCSEHDGQAAFVNPSRQEYQPPSAVPEWGDPTMAASTGGQVNW
ncbi:hypothetical protein FP744_10002644 [Trichoderma asperellum]|nr:hypothetical protein LI328DRAFT_145867 [Trichoderma asperelloides]